MSQSRISPLAAGADTPSVAVALDQSDRASHALEELNQIPIRVAHEKETDAQFGVLELPCDRNLTRDELCTNSLKVVGLQANCERPRLEVCFGGSGRGRVHSARASFISSTRYR
jgi:hypothetical protein